MSSFPPWAACQALMAGRVRGAEKGPGGGVGHHCALVKLGGDCSPNVFCLWPGTRPRRPVELTSSVLVLKQALKEASMRCSASGGSISVRMIGVFCPSMLEVRSMSEQSWTATLWDVRHEWPLGARLFLTAANVGPLSCSDQATDQLICSTAKFAPQQRRRVPRRPSLCVCTWHWHVATHSPTQGQLP